MSEYQYYEFRAIDRPLTRDQISELRALSSRAEITPTSFTNTYNFGDFRGSPHKLMETYFDAHVYVSNFGTVTFMLRLPIGVLPEETLARYATNDGLDWSATDEFTILEWRLDEEPGGDWVDGEGWMGQLLPIRDELMRGDYRSLYIGWLSAIYGEEDDKEIEDDDDESEDDDEYDDDESDEGSEGSSGVEPPVPAGLGSLTSSQAALAEFLSVDSDLIAAAAQASPAFEARASSAQDVSEWVARLPEPEVRATIARLLQGEGMRLQTELQSRYYRSRSETTQKSRAGDGGRRRTATHLIEAATRIADERKRKETAERNRKRSEQLAALIPRLPDLWTTVNSLAEEKKASAYDKICTLLVDMRDAYSQANRVPEFDREFARFRDRNSRSSSLIRRLQEVRLIR